MANRSKEKSDKLRAVEDGLHHLQAKDHQIEEQIMKRAKLRNQLDAIKLGCTREVWLLKKEIENLEVKNRSLVKKHQGKALSSTIRICTSSFPFVIVAVEFNVVLMQSAG
jgi:predicted  nucleic acid-binding Zn-ribbon protein